MERFHAGRHVVLSCVLFAVCSPPSYLIFPRSGDRWRLRTVYVYARPHAGDKSVSHNSFVFPPTYVWVLPPSFRLLTIGFIMETCRSLLGKKFPCPRKRNASNLSELINFHARSIKYLTCTELDSLLSGKSFHLCIIHIRTDLSLAS